MGLGENGAPVPLVVSLAKDAVPVFSEWRAENHTATRAAGNRLARHLGKMPGMVLRLALVLEHLWWSWDATTPPPRAVSRRAVIAAAALATDYFVPMAERAYGDAMLPEADRLAATLARWIAHARPESVNVKTLYRKVRLPGLTTPDAVKTAVERLVDADWLRPSPARDGERGRLRADYTVNPRVWEARGE
ncbi:DUF3987 domain-containing protein [Azospirillum sp. sgz302134]